MSQESLYALPPRLIELIVRRLPSLLTPGDVAFERELAAAAPIGFFRQHPIVFPPLFAGDVVSPPTDSLDARMRQSNERIRAMLEEDLIEKGASRLQVQQYFDDKATDDAQVVEWQLGYAGWLATCVEFRRQRDKLRELVSNAPNQAVLPRLPMNFFPGLYCQLDDEFTDLWNPFYQAWGLEHLATWDLPLPMRPEATSPSLYPIEKIGGAGVLIFLPWYLLRARGLESVLTAREHRIFEAPQALQAWINGDKNWGAARYAILLRLFIYLRLGLSQRYGQRLKGRTESLDRAFAEFLSHDKRKSQGAARRTDIGTTDTIKKIRLHMAKRLTMGNSD